jgi:CRISPR type I-E-associated protein CasB/Cse2
MNERNSAIGEAATAWWRRLQKDAGALARMKRESELIGVQMNEPFYDLVRMLPFVKTDTLACVAMAICHVDTDSERTAAYRFGKSDGTADHHVSELRFRRMIESDPYSASRDLIRMLPMIDNSANVGDIAITLCNWDSEKQISQKRWIREYYLANTKVEQ